MDRETRKIKTSGGFEIEVKTYITGGEMRELRDVILKQMEIKASGETDKPNVEVSGIKGIMVKDREDKQIELLVISVDGQTDNILQRVLDLPSRDYDEVLKEIEITPKSITLNEKKN